MSDVELSESKNDAAPAPAAVHIYNNDAAADLYSMKSLPGDSDSDSDSEDAVVKPSASGSRGDDRMNSFAAVSSPKGKFQLDWRDIKFKVDKKLGRNEVQTLSILKGLSGVARPGKFTAILGASGAGKSSFLNILAGRLRTHGETTVTGEILINGQPLSQRDFEQHSAYVMQHDALLETLTPREAFMFAAKLRLPKSMSLDMKRERVDEMLQALDLNKCADSYIGGNQLQGISGGERKRVSIGIELITNPAIVFVDEPTSGLDSYTAYQTVEVLVDLAHTGRTVISTIHQPNSEMFKMFDDLIVVAEGQIMYIGPASEATNYFRDIGHPCPAFSNPADFFIDLVHGREDKNIEKRMNMAKNASQRLIEPIVKADLSHLTPKEEKGKPVLTEKEAKLAAKADKASTLDQLKLLSWRTAVNFQRQPTSGKVRLMNVVFFGIVLGILFFDLGTTNRAVSGRVGAMFSVLLQVAMSTMMTVILTFPLEMEMFNRERANGMYSTFAYYIAKVIVELPYNIFYTTLFVLIAYPMIGLGGEFEQIFKFWFMLLTASEVAYALGILIGALMPNPTAAVTASSAFILPFVLFSGFFVNVDDMQDWVSWISWLSWVKYAIEAIMVNEFTSDFNVSDCASLEQSGCSYSNGDEVIEFYGYEDVNYWEWWAVLAAMAAFYFALGLIVLRNKAKSSSREPLTKEAPQDV